jgi:glycerol uptake facilitator-like aquaporin
LSGAAFNPVVAMALYLSGKITKQYLFPYIFIEILGGLTGFYLYTKIISKS